MFCSMNNMSWSLADVQTFQRDLLPASQISLKYQHNSNRAHGTASSKTKILKQVYYRPFLTFDDPLRTNNHFPSPTLDICFSLFVQCLCQIWTDFLILNIRSTLLPCLVFCSHFLPMVVLPYWRHRSIHLSIIISQRDKSITRQNVAWLNC